MVPESDRWSRKGEDVTQTTMPFGKHQGTPLDSIPSDYLRWLVSLPNLRPALGWAIVEELEQARSATRSTFSLEDCCFAYLDGLEAGETWQVSYVAEFRRHGGPWAERSRHETYEMAWDDVLEDRNLGGCDIRVRRIETRTPPIEVTT